MVIYNQKMAAYLILKGFVLQSMQRNFNGSGRNVFYFKDSDQLKEAMSGFKNFMNKCEDYLR